MLEDITGDVVSINVPVMVIAGELDQVDRVETLRKELLPRIAGARLHVLPGAGHLSPLEAPSALATVIRQFVGELESHTNTSTPNTPEQVPAAFDAAFNAGDIDSVLGLFSDNATMRMADGENVASGLEELRHQFSELLKAGPRIRNHVRLSLVSDDIALVLLDWTVTVTLPDGQHASSRGTATQVMTRGDDGVWKLRISNPLGISLAAEDADV
jgi:uncharacterized protein (TIGR02246 family)